MVVRWKNGFFHPNFGTIEFVCNGKGKMKITSEAIVINTSGDRVLSFYVKAATSDACAYHLRYGNENNFYVHESCTLYSQGQYIVSDLKIKKDVSTISDVLTKTIQLKGVN